MRFSTSIFFVFLRTLSSLSKTQIFFRLFYVIKRKLLIFFKFVPLKLNDVESNLDTKKEFRSIIPKQYKGDIGEILNLEFSFCNKKIKFKNQINWNKNSMNEGTRLFKLNLHYQDFLVDLSLYHLKKKHTDELNFIIKTIRSWVYKNNFFDSESFKCNWNSYCVSIRLMNYIKVACILKNEFPHGERVFLDNIINQHSSYLTKNLEYDIQGNHLLENHLSLLFSFIFLNNKSAFNKYFSKTIKILDKQILEDGAHYELSTMYHSIIFSRILEIIDYSKSNNFILPTQLNKLKIIATKMLNWLFQIQCQNTIPLLNDSYSSMTLDFSYLSNLYKLVFGHDLEIDKPQFLSDSGYRKFNFQKYEVLIKIGEIGAVEVPGHAHADSFNTLVYDNKGPVFIDPGVSTYNNNLTRHNERSSSYHNNVTYDYKNSSEIWSSFRVGKQCSVDIISDDINFVHAEHNGYSLYGHKVIRKWYFNENQLVIEDEVISKKNIPFYQHWILAPDRSFKLSNNNILINDILISFGSKKNEIIYDEIYIPVDYNRYEKTTRFSIKFYNSLNTKINFV